MNNTKQFVAGSFLMALFLICSTGGTFAQSKSNKPEPKDRWNAPFVKVKNNSPNILWICTDQQKWNTIGALGNPYVKTPNIDRLVREGVSFTKAYCQSPVCTPSRASFLTGMYPSTIHAAKNGRRSVLPGRWLRSHGWRRWCFPDDAGRPRCFFE